MMEESTFSHRPVMLCECIEGLDVRPDGIYVDCTTGGGGHSYEIAKRLTSGRLIAIDQDDEALAAAKKRLSEFSGKVTFVKNNFENIGRICDDLGIKRINGVLADLGVSSYQLDTPERGFSYNHDAPLDMRMDPDVTLTAREVVNTYPEEDLKKIIYDFGEERFSSRIASKIVESREKKAIETTGELVEIIKSAIPGAARENGHHPAKRTFQAIRIEVNRELNVISPMIGSAIDLLVPGGRIAVITFHSLEDRIVKEAFAKGARGCECPPGFPVCVCGKKPILKIITKKPILPSEKEQDENPRSRSAKLRVAEKI